MKVAVLTDSAAIIDLQLKDKLKIKILPLPLLANGKAYYEKYYYDRKNLYEMLKQPKSFLTTGQVSTSAIQEMINRLVKNNYTDVICIHVANSISGLGDNLRSFAQKQNQIRMHIIDSYSFGTAEGNLAVLAAQLVNSGVSLNQIKLEVQSVRSQSQTLIIMKNLNHLATLGYVKNGLSMMGKALFKPKTLMNFGDNGRLQVINTYAQLNRLFRAIRWQIAPAYQEMTGELRIEITVVRTVQNDRFIGRLLSGLQRVFPVAKIQLHDMPLSMIGQIGKESIVISWN